MFWCYKSNGKAGGSSDICQSKRNMLTQTPHPTGAVPVAARNGRSISNKKSLYLLVFRQGCGGGGGGGGGTTTTTTYYYPSPPFSPLPSLPPSLLSPPFLIILILPSFLPSSPLLPLPSAPPSLLALLPFYSPCPASFPPDAPASWSSL